LSEPSVDSEFVDEAVASFGATPHFGDPSGEQWALEAGRALVRRPDLAVISVSGADRLTWLTSLASQIVTGLVPGESRELLILSPEGRVEHWAGASDDGEALHLIVERSDVDSFVAFLDSMRFALRVAVSECDVVVFSSVRAGANTADSVVGLPGLLWTWEDPWPGVVEGGAAYFQGERHPGARTPMMFHAVSRQAADEVEAAFDDLGAPYVVKDDALAAGRATATAQAPDGVTHARRLEHIDGYVSFTHDAGHEDSIIRSVTPNPGAYTVLPGGARMKLDKATPVERDDLEPGQLEVTKKQVTVGCTSGALVLGKGAPAGKSWMDAAAWARGARPSDDCRLGGELEGER